MAAILGELYINLTESAAVQGGAERAREQDVGVAMAPSHERWLLQCLVRGPSAEAAMVLCTLTELSRAMKGIG